MAPRAPEPTFGYRFFHAINVLLRIVIFALLLLLVTRVQRVDVRGSDSITKDQVKEWMSEDKKTSNSLYAVWKYNIRKEPLSPAVKKARVTLKAPWRIRVTVTAWPPAGVVETDDAELVFNREGMIISTSPDEESGISFTGLTPVSEEPYTKLKFEEGDMTEQILALIDLLDDNHLEPEEAAWLGDDDGWQLCFGSVYANLGTAITKDKIEELAELYPEVRKKKGTIHLEYYESGDEIVRFEQGRPSNR